MAILKSPLPSQVSAQTLTAPGSEEQQVQPANPADPAMPVNKKRPQSLQQTQSYLQKLQMPPPNRIV